MHPVLRFVHAPSARALTTVAALILVALGGPGQNNLDHASASSPMQTPDPIVEFGIGAAAPPAEVMINADFDFDILFRNGGDVGYGPYIDLYLDLEGADDNLSSEKCDGLDYVEAFFIGFGQITSLASTPVLVGPTSCPGPSVTAHPITGQSLSGLEGYQLVVIPLPFGSYYGAQPAAPVHITAHVSDFADVGYDLRIVATGGFLYRDQNGLGPPVTGESVEAAVRPNIVTVAKAYDGSEDETATGPNYVRTYTLSVDVADGAQVDDVVVTDRFPNNLAYHGVGNMSAGCTVTSAPSLDVPSSNASLVVNCGTLIGVAGSPEATIEVLFFIPEFDVIFSPVLKPETCTARTVDDVAAEGDWGPWDPRDDPVHAVSDATAEDHSLKDLCLAIVKTGVNVTEGGT